MFMWCAGQFQFMCQGFLAYELTGSAKIIGIISIGYGVPLIILGLFGGTLADRMEKKRLIQVFQGGEALISLVLAVSVISGTITWHHLLFASILHGGLFAFMLPARQALIPQLVAPTEVTNAISLNSAGQSFIGLTGPAIAGTLYTFFGVEFVFISMFVLQTTAMLLTNKVPKLQTGQLKPQQSVLNDIKIGLTVVIGNQRVLVLVGMVLLSTLLLLPMIQLLPVFVVEVYQKEADSLGVLTAVMGFGSLVGSLIVASIGPWKRGLMLILTSFISGFSVIALVMFPSFLIGIPIMLFNGFGGAPQRALKESLAMDSVQDMYRGRVISLMMISYGLAPVGVLSLGLITELYGIRFTFSVIGIVLIIVTTIISISLPSLRKAN